MTFLYEDPALADYVISQTSKKNRQKLQKLAHHVERLYKEAFEPLSESKGIEIPSELVEDINALLRLAESYSVPSTFFVTYPFSELNTMATNLEKRSVQTWLKQVINADDDRDKLTVLSNDIKNAVERLLVSRRYTGYGYFMLITPVCFRQER